MASLRNALSMAFQLWPVRMQGETMVGNRCPCCAWNCAISLKMSWMVRLAMVLPEPRCCLPGPLFLAPSRRWRIDGWSKSWLLRAPPGGLLAIAPMVPGLFVVIIQPCLSMRQQRVDRAQVGWPQRAGRSLQAQAVHDGVVARLR